MGRGLKLALIASRIRAHRQSRQDGTSSIVPLTVVLIIFLLIGLYWFLKTYVMDIKAYLQRNFSRSPRQSTTAAGHEIVGTPLLTSYNVEKAEDVETSLKPTRLNSNVSPKMVKTNEFESDSTIESNHNCGKSPINLKNPATGHPSV